MTLAQVKVSPVVMSPATLKFAQDACSSGLLGGMAKVEAEIVDVKRARGASGWQVRWRTEDGVEEGSYSVAQARRSHAAVREHRGDRVWAEDPQLRALAEQLGMDIAVLDTRVPANAVACYACGSSIINRWRVWRTDLLPRLRRQLEPGWQPSRAAPPNAAFSERSVQLGVFLWNGAHYDAALPSVCV